MRMLRQGIGITGTHKGGGNLLPKCIPMLRQGMGITGTHQGGGDPLPKRIPESSDAADLTTEDFAMATVMATAEGIEPTYEEARKRSDWPKWHEAIQVELKNLEA